MCLIDQDGSFVEVNAALCELFGYDAETLKQKTWQELTAPEYLRPIFERQRPPGRTHRLLPDAQAVPPCRRTTDLG